MSARCDVLVIGGGPAGSVLATLVARAGCQVLLLERARFPRDKVCGEFVSSEGCEVLDRLGVLESLRERGAVPVSSCRISDTRGRIVESPLPTLAAPVPRAIGISRHEMDTALLEQARAAGVTVLEEHEALEPILESGRVCGVQVRRVGRDSGNFSIACPLVVAADGRKSILARALHPRLCEPLRTRPASWFGLKTHLEGDASRLGGRIELHLFDGGYVGLGAVEGNRINVCLMTRVATLRRCGASPERLLRETVAGNPAAAGAIRDAATCGRWLGVGPLRWGIRRPAAAGALFVGDAAGTIDPFAGEGMSNAMRSAELALPWVLEAVAAGGLGERLASEYTRIWRRAFKPVTRRVRYIGRVFERPALASPLVGWLRRGGAGWLPRLVNTTRTGA